MNRILSSLFVCAALAANPALAADDHAQGHSHEKMTQDAASAAALKKRDDLVKAGKLEMSWGMATVKSTEQKTFKKGPEWVVTLQNDAAKDAAKRTLYMFFDMDGHYLAANFTGN